MMNGNNQNQHPTSSGFFDGDGDGEEENLTLTSNLDDSQTSLISNLSDCSDLFDRIGIKESASVSPSPSSRTTRPDVEEPDSPIKTLPPRRPVEEHENFVLEGSHRLPQLTDSSSSFTTQPVVHPPPRSPHPSSASAPTRVVEKRQRGILKKERPMRAAALKVRRPSRNESNGSCSIGSMSTALSRSSNNDLSVVSSSSQQLRIRRPTANHHHQQQQQQRRRRSSMNGGSLHQQGGESMHQPFKSIIKKRVTFWDEQSFGTTLSMSLHRLCDTGGGFGGSGSASPSQTPRFIDTNFQFSIDYDYEEDCDFADDDVDDDYGFGDGFDGFEYSAFAYDVEVEGDDDDDDHESNLDDNASNDVEQDEVKNENSVYGNVVEQREVRFRRVKPLPCVNLDSEDDDHNRDEIPPTEIRWDHDTSIREHGSNIPWFVKDNKVVTDLDEDDVATRETSLPTPTPSNQYLSSATNGQVPRLHNEGNFLFYTPCGEEPVPRNDLLHIDQMPEIPKEWSIVMPNLDDDDGDTSIEEDNQKELNEVEGVQSDSTKSTPLPSHVNDKVTTNVSPSSVLLLDIALGSEKEARDGHYEDEQVQLCTKMLAKTAICKDSLSSLSKETDNHRRLSPTNRHPWVC